jgi:hypothetical protein
VTASDVEIAGHKLTLTKLLIGKRGEVLILSNADLAKVPPANLIKSEPVPPPPFPQAELGEFKEGTPQEEIDAAKKAWAEAKDAWEKVHPVDENVKRVELWAPVFQLVQATMDGYPLKIFHTLRGPVLGMVTSEDTVKAFLHSPCFIDPNIERGRVHYLPLAFAGFEFILYKATSIGESVPQLAELSGYPEFVEANRRGLYQFRMRAAYHHIEADIPDDAPVLSISRDVRHHEEGLIPTSDTREQAHIQKSRIANAVQTPSS